MSSEQKTYNDCNCQPQGKGGLRLQADTMTRLNWVFNFGNNSQSMIQKHVWEGKTATKSFMGLFLGKHKIITNYDAKSGVDQWIFDELSITIDENFIARPYEWKKLEEIRSYVNKTKLSSILCKLVTENPHPALIAPLTILALQFDKNLQQEIKVLVDRIRANPSALTFGSDFSTGCSESGFCSAEFRSCRDCDETINIFDWGFDDGLVGGGGGGGGGGSRGGGGDFDCTGFYWDLVSGCYHAASACEARKNLILDPRKARGIRSLTGQMLSPSRLRPHLRTEEIHLAYDADCWLQLKRCLWAAVQALRLCQKGTHPQSG